MNTLTLSPPTNLVTAAILGPAEDARLIGAFLPANWRLTRIDGLTDVVDPDILLLLDATANGVAHARRRHPFAAVVAVLSPYGDQHDVVGVLDAGADACVRTDSPAIVAAHLHACRRRQVSQTHW